MNRRNCIGALLGLLGTLRAPHIRAQPQEKRRRVGVLMPFAAGNPIVKPDVEVFERALAELGWHTGSTIEIDYRWEASKVDRIQALTRELIAAQCDVIVSRSTFVTKTVHKEAKKVPVVFLQVSDPVGDGIVASMARPGGNITGFTNIVESMSGKWVELLKGVSPAISQITMLYSPRTSPGRAGTYFQESFDAAGRAFGLQTRAIGVEERPEIERAIEVAASSPNGALILAPSTSLTAHRELIITLAARHRLPAMYPFTYWTDHGGLMSYGTDTADLFRRAASYIDRILKGTKPADLPVQAPTKFLFTINRRAAAAANLTIPRSLLALADQVVD